MNKYSVTVLMPVYNSATYLREAIDSILGQTYTNFEFLIIDDGSTDASPEILAEYVTQDKRIKVLRNDANIGLPCSLNKGLACIKSQLTARMDADDIALPERLAQQVAHFTDRPALTVLGTPVSFIDEQGNAVPTQVYYPVCHEDIVRALWAHEANIAHPTVMFRTEAITSLGGYRPVVQFAEDYDLWLRVAEHGILENLQEPLLRYRRSAGSVSTAKATEQALCVALARLSAVCRKKGRPDPLSGLSKFPEKATAVRILEKSEDNSLVFLGEMALENPNLAALMELPAVVSALLRQCMDLERFDTLPRVVEALPPVVPSEYLHHLAELSGLQCSIKYLARRLFNEVLLRIKRI